jgi:DNA helicase-2/ATP-dependent DNA helicase PcrA
MITHCGDAERLAGALVTFMGDIGKGFTPSGFGDLLVREAKEGCGRSTSGKPAAIQAMARRIVDAPDHRGVASALRLLAQLRGTNDAFAQVELDCHAEFWEAVRLGSHADPDEGFARITHHRTHARPKPPSKVISTIHKAKGLECDGVIVMPCDAKTFPDTQEARCPLYVALSRAKRRLQFVISHSAASPLLNI